MTLPQSLALCYNRCPTILIIFRFPDSLKLNISYQKKGGGKHMSYSVCPQWPLIQYITEENVQMTSNTKIITHSMQSFKLNFSGCTYKRSPVFEQWFGTGSLYLILTWISPPNNSKSRRLSTLNFSDTQRWQTQKVNGRHGEKRENVSKNTICFQQTQQYSVRTHSVKRVRANLQV